MINNCLICWWNIGNDNSLLLINWTEIHKSCYEFCCNPKFTEEEELKRLYTDKEMLEKRITEDSWIFNSIWRFFNWNKKDLFYNLEQQLWNINKQIIPIEKKLKELYKNTNDVLIKVYDIWYERPPDWEHRQNKIKSLYHNQCSICNSTKFLQVHHMLPINKWWSHDLDNLILLCRNCHEEEHGNADFSWNYKKNSWKSIFMGRLEKIKQAINNSSDIHFHYKKFEWEKSTRTISPEWLRQEWKSLCVYWYCHLRKDERIFAIRRMTEIEIK